MASQIEAVVYMMPRTLEVPMPSEWVNIHTWCRHQYVRAFRNTEEMDAMVEIAPKQLSDYEQTLLNRLCIWIYDKRREALSQQMKADKAKSRPAATTTQQSLFNKSSGG